MSLTMPIRGTRPYVRARSWPTHPPTEPPRSLAFAASHAAPSRLPDTNRSLPALRRPLAPPPSLCSPPPPADRPPPSPAPSGHAPHRMCQVCSPTSKCQRALAAVFGHPSYEPIIGRRRLQTALQPQPQLLRQLALQDSRPHHCRPGPHRRPCRPRHKPQLQHETDARFACNVGARGSCSAVARCVLVLREFPIMRSLLINSFFFLGRRGPPDRRRRDSFARICATYARSAEEIFGIFADFTLTELEFCEF